MPGAIAAPVSAASSSTLKPESSSACRAAATIIWAKRTILRAFLWSIQAFGSKHAERRIGEHRVTRLLRQDDGQPRVDVARSDDVCAHPAAAQRARERLRESDDPRLRPRVVRLAPVPAQADDARDVDDRSRA